jgi:hypothetical protein
MARVLMNGNRTGSAPAVVGAAGAVGRPTINVFGNLQDEWFEYTITPTPRGSGGSSSTVTVQDKTYQRTTIGLQFQDKQVTINNKIGTSPLIFESSDHAVFTVDSGGKLTHLTTGTATLTIRNDGRRVDLPLTLTIGGGQTTDTYIGGVAGSLRKHMEDQIAAAIAGKSSANNPVYNGAAPSYWTDLTRKPSCWAYLRSGGTVGFDMTAVSPVNSLGNNFYAGAAVTDYDVAFAGHWMAWKVGETITFVANDNTVITRTIVATDWIYAADGTYMDVGLARLDSPLPASITPLKLLPDDWQTYLPGNTSGLPMVMFDQEEHVFLWETGDPDGGTSFETTRGGLTLINYRWPSRNDWLAMNENWVSGDSSDPLCLPINNKLVLCGCLWTWYQSASWRGHKTEIQAKMNAMAALVGGPARTLQTVDLSGFTTF